MSLTLVSSPASISNSGSYNITTSLVEDATHVNLRVRADLYHEGIIKATVEKPKGITDFDFSDILKSLTPGLKFARDSGNLIENGSSGVNLITSWSLSQGSFNTLTSVGPNITLAERFGVNLAFAKTNNIAVVAGEMYCFYAIAFVSSGANVPMITHNEAICKQKYHYQIEDNTSYIFTATATGNLVIEIGEYLGEFYFTGKFNLVKINTNRSTVGNPMAPYFIMFTEVFEDADGVTTTGAATASKLLRYVPACVSSFSNYVLHDSSSLFANNTLRNNITKFYSAIPYELLVSFFTSKVEVNIRYSKDGGAWQYTGQRVLAEGWGVIIINIGELMSSVTSYLTIKITDFYTPFTQYSEELKIYKDTSSLDERVILEFTGDLGGPEYLAFEGLKDQSYTTIRNYFTAATKNRKPLSFTGINRQKLETRFKDINNTEYLKSLLISESVKKMEPSYANPTDVTIITEGVKIASNDLFTNQIDIEYED